MVARKVEIEVTSQIIAEYEARSYPNEGKDSNGVYNLYKVPVYRIIVKGYDNKNIYKELFFMAPRFMPYFNDPKHPTSKYKSLGWINAGLYAERKITITRYLSSYRVSNRYSPGIGAIVLTGTFYIHAGPADLNDIGFGSAGCIEIIGNFDDFKKAIADLSGTGKSDSDDAIQQLIHEKKLIVLIRQANLPNIQHNASRQVRDN